MVKTEMTVFCSAQCGDADAREGQGSHTGVCGVGVGNVLEPRTPDSPDFSLLHYSVVN